MVSAMWVVVVSPLGELGWGTLLVPFVVGLVSSSNSVGVALSQPRVEVRSASTLGIGTKKGSNAVSVAFSRRRYLQQDNGKKCVDDYY